MHTDEYEYHYNAVVSFVYGILVGWFGFLEPFHYYLTKQAASTNTLRYAGNFLPPLFGGFVALAVFFLIQKIQEKQMRRNVEFLALSIGGGLILGNLCWSAIFGYSLPACVFFIFFGAGFSTICFSFPEDNSIRKMLSMGALLLVLGTMTGELLLEHIVSDSSRTGILKDYFSRANYSFAEKRDALKWIPSYVGGVLFIIAFPFAWWVYSTAQKLSIRSYGLLFSILGIGYWFVPMALTGIVNESFLSYPPVLRNQFRIACLFTHSSSSWPTTHYEVQFEANGEWVEGPLEEFFPVDIFGHRTRFNRIVLASKDKNKQGKVVGKNAVRLKEIGMYIKKNWPTVFPNDPEIQRIRYTIANHPVGKKHCMELADWSRPPLKDIPQKYKKDLGVFELEGAQ